MTDNKSKISLNLDDFRMLKMLSIESGQTMESLVHDMLHLIHEQVDYALTSETISEQIQWNSFQIFKALHLKAIGVLNQKMFYKVMTTPALSNIIDQLFDADNSKRQALLSKNNLQE